jgi:hypothetical protein
MAKQKKEKVNRDFSYQDVIDRLGEDEDVSFERVGDTIIMRREEPQAREIPEEYREHEPEFGREERGLEETERKLVLVKREIEKKKAGRISRKDYGELDAAFLRLEKRIDSLDRELRGLRVELGYLRGVMLDKLKGAGTEELIMEKEPKIEEVTVGKDEKQLQLVQEDIPEMKFEEREEKGGRLGFLTSTISNIYNSFFLGAKEGEYDVYKEFQKKLFLLVRTQPRSLDEIAERTSESRASCLIWLTRMVDEGLLEEAVSGEKERRKTYRIVWEKIS